MQLIFPFIDASVPGHERTDFSLVLLYALRKKSPYFGDRGLRKIGINLGIDE